MDFAKNWNKDSVENKIKDKIFEFVYGCASKENITIEPILLNGNNGVYPFPSTQDRIFGYTQLCVKATTIIAVDPNYKPPLPKHRHKFQKTPKPKLHKRSKTITQRP